jgi:hypothetical protein
MIQNYSERARRDYATRWVHHLAAAQQGFLLKARKNGRQRAKGLHIFTLGSDGFLKLLEDNLRRVGRRRLPRLR